MAVITHPGATIEVPYDNVVNGSLGTVGWALYDRATPIINRNQAGVTNPETGYYVVRFTVPANLEGGEYQLRFDDGATPETTAMEETIVVDAEDILVPGWAPTVSRVAALIRTRTRQPESRNELAVMDHDTFTAFSRPTYNQVQELIRQGVADVLAATGGRQPCTEFLEVSACSAAAYRAAQLVEVSYFSEQTNSDQTAFSALAELAKGALETVGATVTAQCPLPDDPDTPGVDESASLFAGRTPGRTKIGPDEDDGMVVW